MGAAMWSSIAVDPEQEAPTIKQALHGDNSHIYICGDSRMAHAVSVSFAEVIGEAPPSMRASRNST